VSVFFFFARPRSSLYFFLSLTRTHSLIHSLALIPPPSHSLPHSLPHSLTPSLTHSLTPSLTHSCPARASERVAVARSRRDCRVSPCTPSCCGSPPSSATVPPSLAHSLAHSLTHCSHSHTHSLSVTVSLTYTYTYTYSHHIRSFSHSLTHSPTCARSDILDLGSRPGLHPAVLRLHLLPHQVGTHTHTSVSE
jgi:hypothetical protein